MHILDMKNFFEAVSTFADTKIFISLSKFRGTKKPKQATLVKHFVLKLPKKHKNRLARK